MPNLTKRNIFFALLVVVALVVLLFVGYVIYTYGMKHDNQIVMKEKFYPQTNQSVTIPTYGAIQYFPAKKIRIYNTNVGTDYSTEGNISIAGVFVYDENGNSIPMTSSPQTTQWIHIDIAGPSYKLNDVVKYASPEASGIGVRLLFEYFC